MLGLHDVADRAVQIGKELADPDDPFQAAVVIRDEYRVRALEPVACLTSAPMEQISGIA